VSTGPALRYYRSLEGSWLGALRFEVTDVDQLRKRPLHKRMMALASRLGSAWMATTLAAEGPSEFLHTTRIFKWKVALFESTELIVVNADGRTFRLSGEQRPRLSRSEPYVADGEVDDSAKRATYRIPWAGEALLQQTHVVEAGLELVQETAWSRASVLLERVALGA
jgi:hypothetical protein